jgi:hypothetical protein
MKMLHEESFLDFLRPVWPVIALILGLWLGVSALLFGLIMALLRVLAPTP